MLFVERHCAVYYRLMPVQPGDLGDLGDHPNQRPTSRTPVTLHCQCFVTSRQWNCCVTLSQLLPVLQVHTVIHPTRFTCATTKCAFQTSSPQN